VRVLLVNPSLWANASSAKTYATFPNGLLYIASVLEKGGHSVRIYDQVVEGNIPESVFDFKPDLIGLSATTSPSITAAQKLSIKFKEKLPEAKIVWGGIHPSLLPEQTIDEGYIDFIVIGAGEYTMLELADKLNSNQDKLSEIAGLCFKRDGEVIINKPRPFIDDLNSLPDPAWHLLDFSKYWDITINTSRGCPFKCTFCYNNPFHKGYRAELSAQRIVDQIKTLRNKYGVKYIKIWEDNFTFNTERLREFCQLLIKERLKIRWDTEARANLAEEDIALMARSGCVSVGLGMETGSQHILNFIKKGIVVKEMEKTFWSFVKHGVMPRLYLMYGFPTETTDDYQATRDLLKRLDNPPYTLGKFTPYPGTELTNYCKNKKLINIPEDLNGWAELTQTTAFSFNFENIPDDVMQEARDHFQKGYLIRPLRFAFKHNLGYLLLFMTSKPIVFLKQLKNLAKYYIMLSLYDRNHRKTAEIN